MDKVTKEEHQESQYHFPYHHLTHETKEGFFTFRHLSWGLEHYTYINFVIDKVCQLKYDSLTDVGCGEGRIISELEKHKNASYTGVDVSSRALNFARGFTRQATFITHDITKNPLTEIPDIIVSCEVIEHIKPDEVSEYIKHISESLNHGGTFILTTPTTNIPTSSKHYQHFTYETLKAQLEPYFSIGETVYLNKTGFLTTFLERCLANRFFISNTFALNKWILNYYRKNLLLGEQDTGSRIYLRCTKIN